MANRKQMILFLCTQNSARSQMAEALMRMMYGDRFEVFSAGTNPGVVNPYAIKAMQELGVDISTHRSKSVKEFKDQEFDYVVTVCDNVRKSCPFFPGKNIIHHAFPDPAAATGTEEEILVVFRQVRDEIRDWLNEQFGQQRICTTTQDKNGTGLMTTTMQRSYPSTKLFGQESIDYMPSRVRQKDG